MNLLSRVHFSYSSLHRKNRIANFIIIALLGVPLYAAEVGMQNAPANRQNVPQRPARSAADARDCLWRATSAVSLLVHLNKSWVITLINYHHNKLNLVLWSVGSIMCLILWPKSDFNVSLFRHLANNDSEVSEEESDPAYGQSKRKRKAQSRRRGRKSAYWY